MPGSPTEVDAPEARSNWAEAPVGRVRIRRVAAGRQSGKLRSGGEPGNPDREGRDRDVVDRDQLSEVPRRIEAEPVAGPEGDQQDERAEEAQCKDRRAKPGRPGLDLWQPEPGVQRGQHEDQGEWIGGDDHQADDTEGQQRGGVTRKLVVDPDWSTRNESIAHEHPGSRDDRREAEQPEKRPVPRCRAGRSERERFTAGPDAEESEDLERGADEEPEQQPASVTPERRRDRLTSPPAAREQIDRRDHEWKQRRDQDELDRPATDHPGTEV